MVGAHLFARQLHDDAVIASLNRLHRRFELDVDLRRERLGKRTHPGTDDYFLVRHKSDAANLADDGRR